MQPPPDVPVNPPYRRRDRAGRYVPEPAADSPREFNPLYLVELVERALREHGIPVDPNPPASRTATAMIAAADLLRALGVTPSGSPWRP